MKKLALAVLFVLLPIAVFAQGGGGGAPFTFSTPTFTGAVVPGAQAPMNENSNVVSHTLTWTISGGTTGCTVQLEGASTAAGSYSTIGVAQSCLASGTYTIEGAATAANFVRMNITALNIAGTVQFNYYGYYQTQGAGTVDNIWNVPWGYCSLTVPVTGVWAAGPASAGTYVGPLMVQAVTKNQLLQGTTTAAASAPNLDCDITPPSRTTAGKGTTITGVQVFYAVQTSALTSVTTPTISTVTFPASGGAAAGTIAAIPGTLALTPASFTLTTSATGVCQSQNITLNTPFLVNTANQRVQLEIIFNQTVASALTIQVCGVQVLYNNNAN